MDGLVPTRRTANKKDPNLSKWFVISVFNKYFSPVSC